FSRRGLSSYPSRHRRRGSRGRSARRTSSGRCARGTGGARRSRRRGSLPEARIGVVGGTGAVGSVALSLLGERGYEHVRVFASGRSAGKRLGDLVVEEATPEALERGDVDVFLFSVGTSASLELVPHAVRGGAVAIDKSAAYRLEPGIPLVVPEVNGGRALEHEGIV